MTTANIEEKVLDMLEDICDDDAVREEAGVSYVDFSSHEYDKNFFQDYSHPSEYGALLYSQTVYNYLKD